MRFLSISITCIALAGCTLIAGKRVGDPPDASEDTAVDTLEDGAGDVGPDFDTDTCGLWGRVYIEDEEAVNINPSDTQLDGHGLMHVALYAWNPAEEPVILSWSMEDVDARNGHHYCAPPDTLGDVTRGYVYVLFVDTVSISEPEQYYQYRSIIGDPLVYTLFLLEMWRPGELDYPSLTDLYWDGSSRNFDIPLKIRTSRLEAEVEFSGDFSYVPPGGRDGRICSYVVAVREVTTGLNYVAIGASYRDVEDHEVVDGGVVDFVINFAAETGQEYKVFAFYIENRDRFDIVEDTSPYMRCGDLSYERSCDCKRAVLSGPGGGVVPTTPRFTVGPVEDVCDLNEASVCPDM